MQNLTDRQLIERELMRFTAAGWRIVSQTETAFQVMYPDAAESALVAIFVVAPLFLGILVSFGSVAFGAVLFWIALIAAALIALGHLCARPKLLYMTADQLRKPAQIDHTMRGVTICSRCSQPTSTKNASCLTCGAQFVSA